MSRVIGGIYEIQNQIGSGGGGTVYLGRHLRLEKQVVLKADKRSLSASQQTLRREVDMLKGLSHTYIPQVYDFVQEDGIVYTVMDYIEGESLDKLLKRGQLPSQPKVITWACQLLEALCYLHTRPPHGILHGDIKPANIMLRPGGDICLIDYNIALALGENGAVKVGSSRGYASPEHYGTDFDTQKTETLSQNPATEPDTGNTRAAAASGTEKRASGILDVRSDIYSLGATLYHLLSGSRPPQNAAEVTPLGQEHASPQVSAILKKAMDPRPDMRYQSAQEMLSAFLELHKKDARVVAYKKQKTALTGILSAVFLLGGVCAFVGLKQLEQMQTALTLAEYSLDYLAKGDVDSAVLLALRAIPEGNSMFEGTVTAQAQKALTDALGVYDLSDGFKDFGMVSLPSAPFGIAVSPGGSCFLVRHAYEASVFQTEDLKKAATCKLRKSALSDALFLDESRVVYAGEDGITAYDWKTDTVLWTGKPAVTLSVSGDKTKACAIDRAEGVVRVYRIADGKELGERSFPGLFMSFAANDIFADPDDCIFSLNQDGSMLAVSFSNRGLYIFNLENEKEDLILYEESEYSHFQGGFLGKYFGFTAGNSTKNWFGLVDTEEGISIGGYESPVPFLMQVGETGFYLAKGNLLVCFDPETLEETELAFTSQKNITDFSVGSSYVLAATDDKGFSFFDRGSHLVSTGSGDENYDFVELTEGYAILSNRNNPAVRVLKLESHKDARLLSYDARYPHDEARISQDGETAMLFSYEGFQIYRMDGTLAAQAALPDAENIYDQQFRKSQEGSELMVTWYDGKVRCYSSKDGSLVSETQGEPPDKSLYEEFDTDKYRIESRLHDTPKAYDKKSGRLAAELEKESYLTYVTQAGDYILTEYISAAGERYGLLLDEKLQTLAYLPGLCDITEEGLVFDYHSGELRTCPLYSLGELVFMGNGYLTNEEKKGDE